MRISDWSVATADGILKQALFWPLGGIRPWSGKPRIVWGPRSHHHFPHSPETVWYGRLNSNHDPYLPVLGNSSKTGSHLLRAEIPHRDSLVVTTGHLDSVDGPLRNMARIRAAYLLSDKTSVEVLKKRLAGLDVPGSAWRGSANEIIALAEYRAGNLAEADKLITVLLADPETPAGLRQRAQLFAALLRPQLDSKANK